MLVDSSFPPLTFLPEAFIKVLLSKGTTKALLKLLKWRGMRFYLVAILIFLLSPAIEDISNRAMYKIEVRLNLPGRDFRPRPDLFYRYEPSQASTCDEFVELLVDNFLNRPAARSHFGGNMLN
jgi:hypothetical protein